MSHTSELVVLLDDELNRIGSTDKDTVHTTQTPLHLAFSCYVEDRAGNVLMTRRALSKRTWPGVWTNSFCGHPAPEESMDAAVQRRAVEELGLQVHDIRTALPDFRYRAESPEGIVENEFCPVFLATAYEQPTPNPSEVAQYVWVPWERIAPVARATPWILSPWAAEQIAALHSPY
ncbi:isopentenyl-diphosphate Delta-isomerase [Lipingzhangella sp. LS1_29]|uniref:Isopentenyl-diphosphate Delta-isomerase n=1 Tax=Lipingzhangella rawalii TaxID=2055835 RepID=A0ABU2H697_9ACTN|nr:isopentenyl-diphosphate Delta-isomerase [Lipingzhangella rawalii]MDS1270839.1 isopentenyl-diphosphate Delta-isomerase [Lipingzhangella rawalii]